MTLYYPGYVQFGGGKPSPIFHAEFNSSGVANLPRNLTINGSTVAPDLVYYGGDATNTTWAAQVGGTLTNAGSGALLNQGSPGLGSDDDSVDPNGTQYWVAGNGTLGDVDMEDMVVELVYKHDDSDTGSLIVKRDSSIAARWEVYTADNAGQEIRFAIVDYDLDYRVAQGPASDQTWYHIMFFVDRSDDIKLFINGVVSGVSNAGGAMTDVGSVSNTDALSIGAYNDGQYSMKANIAYVAMWKKASWLDTPNQAALAKERCHRFCGTYPTIATGTAVPEVYTRASSAYLDKIESGGERRLYLVGTGYPRIVNRYESDGTTQVAGYLAENASTNKIEDSEDFSAWTALDAGDTIDAISSTAPNGLATGEDWIADATDGEHGYSVNVTLTAADHILSVWAKKGDKNWLYLSDDTVANATCYFDLDNGVKGTKGAGVSYAIIEDWGNDWYRCGIQFLGTVASHTLKIQTAEADNDKEFAGDGSTVNTILWGAMCELESHINWMTSYIPTSGATATRIIDVLYYTANDGNVNLDKGTCECKIMFPDFGATTANNIIVEWTNGAGDTDRLLFYMPNSNLASFFGRSDSVPQWVISDTTTDMLDGDEHILRGTWKTDDVKMYIDGTNEGTNDTSCVAPAVATRINVSQNYNSSLAGSCLLHSFKIWNKIVKP